MTIPLQFELTGSETHGRSVWYVIAPRAAPAAGARQAGLILVEQAGGEYVWGSGHSEAALTADQLDQIAEFIRKLNKPRGRKKKGGTA